MNDILEMEKKLIEMVERLHRKTNDYYGKAFEPSVMIEVGNDLKWYAEIYSYLFDFNDGGRHHSFEADTYDELIKKLWNAIYEEEKKIRNI